MIVRLTSLAVLLTLLGSSLLGCRSSLGTHGGRSIHTPMAREYYAQATDLLAQGQTDEALALLSRAIEQNPKLTAAHVELGQLYLDQGDPVRAERRFADAAHLEPDNFRAQYGQGLALHLLGRLAAAIHAYIRALSIDPDDFKANLNIAIAYLKLEGPAQARAYAERSILLNPASGPAHANLGAVYSAMGDARSVADRDAEARTFYEQAVREYESAAELMDLTDVLLLNWANTLGKLARYQEMVNTLSTIVRNDPSANAYERLGYAYFKLRQYTEAQDAFRDALGLDHSHYPANNGLGVCLLNDWILSGKKDEMTRAIAISHLRASLRANPSQPRIVELVSRYAR